MEGTLPGRRATDERSGSEPAITIPGTGDHDGAEYALKHARLTQSHEAELRKLLAVDLLILDDFALDAMEAPESRDAYEVFLERDRAGSLIVASNRGPDEWLATFADPVRAQSALDRFTSRAYDLVIEGESYRTRLKPSRPAPARKGPADHG